MSVTIALLCALGQNANLRHASPANRAEWLSEHGGSPALVSAAATEQRMALLAELGDKVMGVPQIQMPWRDSENVD